MHLNSLTSLFYMIFLSVYIAHELSQNKKDTKNNEQRLKCGSYLTLKAKEFRNIRKKKEKDTIKKLRCEYQLTRVKWGLEGRTMPSLVIKGNYGRTKQMDKTKPRSNENIADS